MWIKLLELGRQPANAYRMWICNSRMTYFFGYCWTNFWTFWTYYKNN